jgi:hypothetical protein
MRSIGLRAVKPSGNVYAFEAIEQLNFKTKNMTDLLTGEAFKRSEIITIQDPSRVGEKVEMAAFHHLREGLKADPSPEPEPAPRLGPVAHPPQGTYLSTFGVRNMHAVYSLRPLAVRVHAAHAGRRSADPSVYAS